MNIEEKRPWQAFHDREVRGSGWSGYGESLAGHKNAANQDSFILMPLQSTPHLLAAVADGLGGHNAGDVASQTACEAIYACVTRGLLDRIGETGKDVKKILAAMTLEAHQAIASRSAGDPELDGMGSTLTMALIDHESAWFCHVGDSRLYHISGTQCRQLTEDDAPEDLGVNADTGHMLEQALGLEDPGGQLDIHGGNTRLVPGDSLLLCSDGLSDCLAEQTLADIVSTGTSTVKRAHDLVQAALHAGSSDDITTLLVDLARA